MKKFMLLWLAVTVALGTAVSCRFRQPAVPEETASEESVPETTEAEEKEEVPVYVSADEEVRNIPLREYIIGATAGEMPAVYEHDALCAQALASLTLTVYFSERTDGDEAVISTDPAHHQAYMTVEEMQKKWGDDFDLYYQKLEDAADEILPYVITYKGETAMAAFHAISPGRTESALNVWDDDIPYLTPVDSSFDERSPRFSSSVPVSADEFREKLGLSEDTRIDPEHFDTEVTDSGTVKKVTIGGKEFTGAFLRTAFSLRSAAFTVTAQDGGVVFSVRGYGHGVGLSQYGADCLAREGKTWREILAYYYPGTKIEKRSPFRTSE